MVDFSVLVATILGSKAIVTNTMYFTPSLPPKKNISPLFDLGIDCKVSLATLQAFKDIVAKHYNFNLKKNGSTKNATFFIQRLILRFLTHKYGALGLDLLFLGCSSHQISNYVLHECIIKTKYHHLKCNIVVVEVVLFTNLKDPSIG